MKITKAICAPLVLFVLFAQPVLAARAPFSISIALLHDQVRGGYVQLTSTITNTSSHEITLHERNRACDYSVDVRDEQGKSPPETPFKQNLQCSGEGFLLTGRNMIVVLKPQESYNDQISASELFSLTKPGEYTIQVSRKFLTTRNKKDGGVKSNKITVTVIP
jgi:hypothetical protein